MEDHPDVFKKLTEKILFKKYLTVFGSKFGAGFLCAEAASSNFYGWRICPIEPGIWHLIQFHGTDESFCELTCTCQNYGMSYVVVIRIQFEGDPSEYESLIQDFRIECLAEDTGLEEFRICSAVDDEHGFLVVQIFTSEDAHLQHMNSSLVQQFLETLQTREIKMGVIMMAGHEIGNSLPGLLN